ncbi:MAG: NAD-dependent epimerase/dehydratase family protein [Gammaproteobacteria bacterium]|nr:NAD-dependent epimerase/dehydratase family protein [Gammaproteobacteria bacterium]
MTKYIALIAGATGAIGSALARQLSPNKEWKVYGVSRHTPQDPIAGVIYLTMDMNDRGNCESVLADHPGITHVFYCGRATHGEQMLESAEDNLRLLDNLIHGVESSAHHLQHVHLVQGGKYYGVHIGPFPSPAREEDSRAPIPNFNYAQQDYLAQRADQSAWSWSASRPNTLIHYSPSIARNLVSSLGTYAAICRELGAALDFPGPVGAFNSLTQLTSIDLLARGIDWMSTEKACGDNAFNMTNTDLFRWKSLWPKIAHAFGMPCGEVRPMTLTTTMADRDELWSSICANHQLQDLPLSRVANWGYLDATLERYWDEIFSHTKTRKFGFHDWDDSEERFLAILRRYQQEKILPF